MYTGFKVDNNGTDKATVIVDMAHHMVGAHANRKLVQGRGGGATAE